MDSSNILINTLIQTQNLYKSAFNPPQPTLQHKKRLLLLELQTKYDGIIKKMQSDTLNKQSTQQTQKQKPKVSESQIQQIINQYISPTSQQRSKIKTFEKYESNVDEVRHEKKNIDANNQALVPTNKLEMGLSDATKLGTIRAGSLRKLIKPTWHAPWKLYRVIVGHQGWVRSVAVSPCNTFFATGSADRTIKFWDLASGELKISLTGHINTVRALQFSKHYPYLFSCGQDKAVKCWDLQMNKAIRNYHGHLSGVYCLKVHDGLSILVTGGRDSAARVWDIRVRKQIHTLVGHSHTVGSIITQEDEPHVVTGSYDSFVKLWDIGQGRCIKTLTNHKKSIRTMVEHPKQYTFATAASDNIKVWKCPNGEFQRNISGHNSIIDSMAVNQDNVLVTGGDDGTMMFWDWSSGYNFQNFQSQPQPGSIAAQNAIFALSFDKSGSRLLSCECDKTIKLYKQDPNATQDTHPIKSFKMQFA